jgi:hypothetical protein
MARNKAVCASVIMGSLLLLAACGAPHQHAAIQQLTATAVTTVTPTLTTTRAVTQLPTYILSPIATEVTTTTTPNEFSTHAVLAYGYGRPSAGRPAFSCDDLLCFAIPELLVYEDGLVLFSCEGKAWPKVCQSNVSPERVDRLLDDLAAADFFGQYRAYSPGTGPQVIHYIVGSTAEAYGEMRWFTLSFDHSTMPDPLLSVVEIMETLREEVQASGQLYWPGQASLWVWGCQCPPPADVVWGDGGYEGLYNYCDDLGSLPKWPFGFDPPPIERLAGLGWEQAWELPQPMSAITSAISDPLCQVCVFRDGSTVLAVQIRPYLPGEVVQAGRALDRWSRGWGIAYDRLPFYAIPDLAPSHP